MINREPFLSLNLTENSVHQNKKYLANTKKPRLLS